MNTETKYLLAFSLSKKTYPDHTKKGTNHMSCLEHLLWHTNSQNDLESIVDTPDRTFQITKIVNHNNTDHNFYVIQEYTKNKQPLSRQVTFTDSLEELKRTLTKMINFTI